MLSDFFEDFIMQNWTSEPDGFGGIIWTLSDGASFRAGIATQNSAEAQLAYQAGTKTVYRIAHRKTLVLEQDDRVKRIKDGRIYRITSNSADMTTPAPAQEQFAWASAEMVVTADDKSA